MTMTRTLFAPTGLVQVPLAVKIWMSVGMRASGVIGLTAVIACAPAQTRLLLQKPTVSRTLIAFSYAGDLWTVPRQGGDAKRLTAVARLPDHLHARKLEKRAQAVPNNGMVVGE